MQPRSFVLAGFFVWRNAAYVDTFHARVLGDATVATVPANGRVLQCDVEVGDAVAEGEELGIIEVYLSSSPGGRVALPVRAPVSGVIVERPVGVSEAVAAGQPLVTIMDPNDMWVEANINEARIAQVKVGQDVRVRVRALKVSFQRPRGAGGAHHQRGPHGRWRAQRRIAGAERRGAGAHRL
ncbi:MAG: HlyD family efflux transporter periplasmic adaptor subunit [Anaerolineae bacterium]